MTNQYNLQPSEEIIFRLRSLYDRYGYSRYKMSKFEEYDLYARNRDFLVSESVITFNEGGKLMALKPDVTLSIVKNTRDGAGGVQKLYYNENVYRIPKGSRSFREFMQVGLEALGDIDGYCVCEVLGLACESLRSIGGRSILEVSHLGVLTEVMESVGIPEGSRSEALRLIGEKNVHELTALCADAGVTEDMLAVMKAIVTLRGTPREVQPELQRILSGLVSGQTLGQWNDVISALDAECIFGNLMIDFSVVDDIHYYSGFVFKGFVEGIPSSVLSGGQYDRLMRKMKRSSGAIGFAVYLDMLEQIGSARGEYDVDTVLLYDGGEPIESVRRAAARLTEGGVSVSVQRQIPEGMKYKKLVKFQGGEVITVENNA